MAGTVPYVESKAEFDELLKSNAKVAVDFTASWCGPCRMIGPKFEEFSSQYPNIKFVKVDVDKNSDTAEAHGVSAMPTFKFFANGEQVDELVGASETKLKECLDKLN